jgi:hypothetical protein
MNFGFFSYENTYLSTLAAFTVAKASILQKRRTLIANFALPSVKYFNLPLESKLNYFDIDSIAPFLDGIVGNLVSIEDFANKSKQKFATDEKYFDKLLDITQNYYISNFILPSEIDEFFIGLASEMFEILAFVEIANTRFLEAATLINDTVELINSRFVKQIKFKIIPVAIKGAGDYLKDLVTSTLERNFPSRISKPLTIDINQKILFGDEEIIAPDIEILQKHCLNLAGKIN